MTPRLVGLINSSLLVLAAGGCAHRGETPMFVDTQVETPEPNEVVCSTGANGTARLEVFVRDQGNAAFPGTAVYLVRNDYAPGAIQPPAAIGVYTNEAGRAVLEAPGNHSYTLLVALAAFMPSAQVLHLKSGCSGKVTVVLELASTEGLLALKGRSHK